MSRPVRFVLTLFCLFSLVACDQGSPSAGESPYAQELQQALDSSREAGGVMGVSAAIIDGEGRLNLYDRHGFRIFLGAPQNLPEKIGALPKALRICEENRGQLEYLDASSPHVFYEKWQEPSS